MIRAGRPMASASPGLSARRLWSCLSRAGNAAAHTRCPLGRAAAGIRLACGLIVAVVLVLAVALSYLLDEPCAGTSKAR